MFSKKCIFRFCVLALLLLIVVFPQKTMAHSVREKAPYVEYQYPIRQTDNEWGELISHQDMLDACQLPMQCLQANTLNLLATVLHYPLLGDVFLWDSIEKGIDVFVHTFNGIEELLKREDLFVSLISFEVDEMEFDYEFEGRIARRFFSVLLDYIGNQKKNSMSTRISPVLNDNVRTPSGIQVLHYENLTWDFFGYSTPTAMDDLYAYEEYRETTYCYATKISSMSPSYNCHSYAWHSNAVYNPYWIDSPSAYTNDPYYSAFNYYTTGDRVIYIHSTNGVNHSARVTNSVVGGAPVVTSKWGYLGVYSHSIYHCPYYSSYVSFLYYHH